MQNKEISGVSVKVSFSTEYSVIERKARGI